MRFLKTGLRFLKTGLRFFYGFENEKSEKKRKKNGFGRNCLKSLKKRTKNGKKTDAKKNPFFFRFLKNAIRKKNGKKTDFFFFAVFVRQIPFFE